MLYVLLYVYHLPGVVGTYVSMYIAISNHMHIHSTCTHVCVNIVMNPTCYNTLKLVHNVGFNHTYGSMCTLASVG